MNRFGIGIGMVLVCGPALADVRVVEPRKGSAAAVVVADAVPLVHSRHIAGGKAGDLAGQLDHAFANLANVLNNAGSSFDRLVKINFVLARDSAADVEQYLARKFAGKHKPAVSYVAGEVPGNGLIALDAVAAGTRQPAWKAIQRTNTASKVCR